VEDLWFDKLRCDRRFLGFSLLLSPRGETRCYETDHSIAP
jgi:hypothetical protein